MDRNDCLSAAVTKMAAMITFFPQSTLVGIEIARMLDRMVDTEEHLAWLVETAINTITKWQGLPQLRGLYCSRFEPKDGIFIASDIPGFTTEDATAIAEQRFFESEAAATSAKIEQWRQERKLLGATEQKAIEGVTQEIETRLQIAAGSRLELEAPPPDPRKRIAGPMGPTPIRSEEENQRLLIELQLQLRNLQRGERVRELLSPPLD